MISMAFFVSVGKEAARQKHLLWIINFLLVRVVVFHLPGYFSL
jgi:hypothetical protein